MCLVYLDDVLVVGRTLEEHNKNLARVLERFCEAGLKLKLKKCKFVQSEVEYLSHIVSADGIRTDPKKLEAVRKYPLLQTCRYCTHSWVWPPITSNLYQELQPPCMHSPKREHCLHGRQNARQHLRS